MKEERCIQCNASFVITPQEDLSYKQIGVIFPKKCPVCMKLEADRDLYTHDMDIVKCVSCDVERMRYTVDFRGRVVMCPDCKKDRFKDGAPSLKYIPGKFIEQLNQLISMVPLKTTPVVMNHEAAQNSLRSAEISFSKNSIDCFDLSKCLNCVDVQSAISATNCIHCSYVNQVEDCSDLVLCNGCTKCTNSSQLFDCYNVHYSDNCTSSKDCFGCSGLRDTDDNYGYIFNKRVSKEEFKKRLHEFDKLSNEELIKLVEQEIRNIPVPRQTVLGPSEDCYYTEQISRSKSCYYAFISNSCENSGYLWQSETMANCWNMYRCRKGEDSYFCTESSYFNGLTYCHNAYELYDSSFCYDVAFSKYCFGCVGISRVEYHILNTKYSPEEYHKLVKQIKEELKDYFIQNSNE